MISNGAYTKETSRGHKTLTAGTYARLSGHHVVRTGRAKKELDLNVWLRYLICC
jgi:hypothetical protein